MTSTTPKPTHPWKRGINIGWLCKCQRRNSYNVRKCTKCGKRRDYARTDSGRTEGPEAVALLEESIRDEDSLSD